MTVLNKASRRPGVLATVVGLVGLALVAAGCSSSSGSSSSAAAAASDAATAAASSAAPASSAASQDPVAAAAAASMEFQTAPTVINQTNALAKAPTKGTKAVFMQDPTPANQLAGRNACEAVKSVGWECETLSYDSSDPASFQATVRSALQSGAKYLMEDGTPPSILGPEVLKEICDAGAFLIAASVYPDETKDCVNTVANGGPSRTKFAEAVAMWFIADSGGTGHALVETISQYPVLLWFATEFKRIVEENCVECKVDIAEFTGADLGNGAVIPALVSALRADPSIGYLIFDYAAFSTGIVAALDAAGIENVKVAGTGLDKNALAALKDGTNAAWVAQSWFQEGYAMADVALRIETGSDGIDGTAVTPMQLITPDNTADVDGLDNEWNRPADALAQFQKLWAAS